MTVQRLAAFAVLALLAAAPCASAQTAARGFAFGGMMSEGYSEWFPAFGGGAVVDLGQPWVSAGAQGETFMSWPYFAGRGAVFAQGNLLARKSVRPFVLAGIGFGEDGGTLVGAGLEVRSPDTRLGFRVTVEDYLTRRSDLYGQLPRVHRIALRAGVLF
jgi:hypothetical protein